MKELKKTAFIEVSLFEDPPDNIDLVSSGIEKENNSIKTNRKSRSNPKAESHQRDLQKTWEEMYKSVEKSKRNSNSDNDSELESLEQKLIHIKKLRDQKRISEQEYQERKERLLKRL